MQVTLQSILSGISGWMPLSYKKTPKDVRLSIARRCILLLSSQQYNQVDALMSHELTLILKQNGLKRLWEYRFNLYGELKEIKKLHLKQIGEDIQIDYRCLFSKGRAVFRIRLNKDAAISDMKWFDAL